MAHDIGFSFGRTILMQPHVYISCKCMNYYLVVVGDDTILSIPNTGIGIIDNMIPDVSVTGNHTYQS